MTGVTISMDHKAPEVSPTVQVVDETRPQSNIGKHKIWALVGVLVTLVVIGGIVAIVVVMLNHSDRIQEKSVTLKPAPGVTVNETIRVNADKRTEEYDVKKLDLKVLHDFKKGLSVYRLPDGRGSHYCVVTVLESDKVPTPEDTYDALNKDPVEKGRLQAVAHANSTDADKDDDTETLWYQYNKANVEQRGFLNDDMRDACSGNELFWAISSNKPAEDAKSGALTPEDTKQRNKRALYYRYYCYYYFYYGRLYRRCYVRVYWVGK